MTESPDRVIKQQQLRLRRLRIALLAWVITVALTIYAWSLGLMNMSVYGLALLLLVVLTAHLAFHTAIRRGWNLRFKDPSLTLPQMIVATLIALWVISHADEARTIMLMLFIIAIFFGIFQLRKLEFLLVAVVAVTGYGLIILNDHFAGDAGRSTELVLLEFGGFAAVMFWLAFVGAYVADLRRTLSQRNRELREATAHLKHISEHDELTGLPNRRLLLAQLEQAHTSAVRSGKTFSLVLLDLDNFKRVNDRHGHLAGDQVLTRFAELTDNILRGNDRVMRIDKSIAGIGRFGGEEFLAILPGTDLAGARLAAERIRQEIAGTTFETDNGPVQCTVSAGLAEYAPDEALQHTLGRADEALYLAKENGRNQVAAIESQ